MARNYYKDGLPLAVKNRKEKFAQYNIERDLNGVIYSYSLKDIYNTSEENIGLTQSEMLTRMRTQGDTEIIYNLQKDKNLFPAGKLEVINKGGTENPIFATDDEGAVFSNSQTLNFISKLDVTNLGGKDQVRFFTKDELVKKDPITGDKRNIGVFKDGEGGATDQFHSHQVTLPSGKILIWMLNEKKFYILEDESLPEIEYGFNLQKWLNDLNILSLHDIKYIPIYEDGNIINFNYALLCRKIFQGVVSTVLVLLEIDQTDEEINHKEINLNINPPLQTRPKMTLNKDGVFFININNQILRFDLMESLTNSILEDENSHIIGSTQNYVFSYVQTKKPNIVDFEFKENSYIQNGLNSSKTIPQSTVFIGDKFKKHNFFCLQIDENNSYFLREISSNSYDEINIINEYSLGILDDVELKLEYNEYLSRVILYYKSDTETKILLFDDSLEKNDEKILDNQYSYGIINDSTSEIDSCWGYWKTDNDNSRTTIYTFKEDFSDKIDEKTHNAKIDLSIGNLVRDNLDGNWHDYKFYYSFDSGLNDSFLGITRLLYDENKENYKLITTHYFTENELVATDYISSVFTLDYNLNLIDSFSSQVNSFLGEASIEINLSFLNADNYMIETNIGGIEKNYFINLLNKTQEETDIKGTSLFLPEKDYIGTIILNENCFYVYNFDKYQRYFKIIRNNAFELTYSLNFYLDEYIFQETWFNTIIEDLYNNKILFGGNGYIVSITDDLILKVKKYQIEDSTDVYDIIDIEKDIINNNFVAIAMPFSTTTLKQENGNSKIFSFGQNLEYITPPKELDYSYIEEGESYFINTNGYNEEEYRQNGFKIDGIQHKIAIFGNGQIYVPGIFHLVDSDEYIGGVFANRWSTKTDTETPLGDDVRETDILPEDDNKVTGQQIFMTSSINETPTGSGDINHYDYKALRWDIPKLKNSDGKLITPTFYLDAAIKGVNVKYIDIESESFVLFNQIQFLDDDGVEIPFNITETNWGEQKGLRDEEIKNPDLFNDGEGNDLWHIYHTYPIVNGSIIKWEFSDVTTYRYYEFLKESLENSGGVSDFLRKDQDLTQDPGGIYSDLETSVRNTLIKGTSYQVFGAGGNIVPFLRERKFSGEFLKSMYAGTIGCGATGNDHDDFSTIDGNYGMSLEDNRFFKYQKLSTSIPERRWPFSFSIMIIDSFLRTPPLQSINPLGADYWWSMPILNPKLFNVDDNGKEESQTEIYKDYKNEMIKGSLTWNGTTFSQNFVSDNGGDLSTVVKNPDLTKWSNGVLDDTKYLVLAPTDFDTLKGAISSSDDGENPQSYKTVPVIDVGFLSNSVKFYVEVPEAEGMYSRLNQNVFTEGQLSRNLGFKSKPKIRLEFLSEKTPNRFRINGYGGKNWTFYEWDSNFNLAKDAQGDEVVPRSVQSPNVSVLPNSSFKDILLSF